MLLDKSFFKNVSKLAGATLIAQAIGVVTMPIYTRLFSPDVVGQYALITAAVGLCGVFSTGRYEYAVMLPKSEEKAEMLMAGSSAIAIIWSALICLALFIWKDQIISIGEYYKIADYLLVVPILVLMAALMKVFQYWFNRKMKFGYNAKITILHSVIWKGGNILFGFCGYATVFALVVVNVLANGIELLLRFREYIKEKVLRHINFSEIKRSLAEYKRFALIDIWNGFLDQGSIWIVPILLSIYFSTKDVGLYSQALLVVQLPLALISGAFGQVFYQKFSVADKEDCPQIIAESTVVLSAFGIPVFLMLFFGGRYLFSFFFGSQWEMSGYYAELLAAWCGVRMVFSPLSTYFEAIQRQDVFLGITILTLLSRVASIVIGGYMGNCTLSILLFGISGLILNLFGIIVIYSLSKTKFSTVLVAAKVQITKISNII